MAEFSFKQTFSLDDRWESLKIYDSLLVKLASEPHKKWTLEAIEQYMEKIYSILADLSKNTAHYYIWYGDKLYINEEKNSDKTRYIGFSTGLVNQSYNAIYCFGEKVENEKYSIIGFYSEGDRFDGDIIDLVILEDIENVDNYFQEKIVEASQQIQNLGTILKEEPNWEQIKDDCEKRKKLLMPKQTSTNISKKKKRKPANEEQKIKPFDIKDGWDVTAKGNQKKVNNEGMDDYIYNGKVEKLHGWSHLIIDGVDNLPSSMLTWLLDEPRYYLYWKYDIQYKILTNDKYLEICKCIYEILKRAIEYSIKLSKQRNLLAPYYYIESIEDNKINFMMPLFLSHDDKPDCAILFDKQGNPKTLLNMDEVYTDLRLVGRVDAYNWLSDMSR